MLDIGVDSRDELIDAADSEAFELTAVEAQLSARDKPPQAPEELRVTIHSLLERMRRFPESAPRVRR